MSEPTYYRRCVRPGPHYHGSHICRIVLGVGNEGDDYLESLPSSALVIETPEELRGPIREAIESGRYRVQDKRNRTAPRAVSHGVPDTTAYVAVDVEAQVEAVLDALRAAGKGER